LYKYGVHEVAGVLKFYLRTLPDSIFTLPLYSNFLESQNSDKVDEKIKTLKSLVGKLPDPRRVKKKFFFPKKKLKFLKKKKKKFFYKLVVFLAVIASKSSQNKMSALNLAKALGPNLIFPLISEKMYSGNNGWEKFFKDGQTATLLLQLFIEQYEKIFV
jgi:hypothetical protein